MSYLQRVARGCKGCKGCKGVHGGEAPGPRGCTGCTGMCSGGCQGCKGVVPLVVGLKVHVRAVGARVRLAVMLRRGHQVELRLHVLLLVRLAQLRICGEVEVAHLVRDNYE